MSAATRSTLRRRYRSHCLFKARPSKPSDLNPVATVGSGCTKIHWPKDWSWKKQGLRRNGENQRLSTNNTGTAFCLLAEHLPYGRRCCSQPIPRQAQNLKNQEKNKITKTTVLQQPRKKNKGLFDDNSVNIVGFPDSSCRHKPLGRPTYLLTYCLTL